MPRPSRILILTDSLGLPRASGACQTEFPDTWPAIIEDAYHETRFARVSCGGVTLPDLLEQARFYHGWSPDVVVVQSGIVDCAPRVLRVFEQQVADALKGGNYLLSKILSRGTKSFLRKVRGLAKTPPTRFRKSAQMLHDLFPESRMIWFEIVWSASEDYEKLVPGIGRRVAEYNAILGEIPGIEFLPLQDSLLAGSGICSEDHRHLNSRGHEIASGALEQVIFRRSTP